LQIKNRERGVEPCKDLKTWTGLVLRWQDLSLRKAVSQTFLEGGTSGNESKNGAVSLNRERTRATNRFEWKEGKEREKFTQLA